MNCKGFRDRIFLFQADELSLGERVECQAHLDGCEACAARLRVEETLLGALRSGLRRTQAPPGLESRVRAALRAEADGARRAPWYTAGWFATAAVAALLALLLVGPAMLRTGTAREGTGSVAGRVVTVVDLDCDRAGRSLEEQRDCRHPLHVNALKLADGWYWSMDPEPEEFRYLLLDPRERGQTLRVAGRVLPGTRLIRLDSVERFDAGRRLPPRPTASRTALTSMGP